MILPIYAYGHPILRKETQEIEELNEETKTLIENMFETMYGSRGVGLAAPQIGKALRLFIIDGSPFAEDEAENEEEENNIPRPTEKEGVNMFENPFEEIIDSD
jgi:peptide deformylase